MAPPHPNHCTCIINLDHPSSCTNKKRVVLHTNNLVLAISNKTFKTYSNLQAIVYNVPNSAFRVLVNNADGSVIIMVMGGKYIILGFLTTKSQMWSHIPLKF